MAVDNLFQVGGEIGVHGGFITQLRRMRFGQSDRFGNEAAGGRLCRSYHGNPRESRSMTTSAPAHTRSRSDGRLFAASESETLMTSFGVVMILLSNGRARTGYRGWDEVPITFLGPYWEGGVDGGRFVLAQLLGFLPMVNTSRPPEMISRWRNHERSRGSPLRLAAVTYRFCADRFLASITNSFPPAKWIVVSA